MTSKDKERFDGCGWQRWDKDYSLQIGKLPGRKRIALYFHDYATATIRPLAYFVGEKEALEALNSFNDLVGPVEELRVAGIPGA